MGTQYVNTAQEKLEANTLSVHYEELFCLLCFYFLFVEQQKVCMETPKGKLEKENL